MPFLYLFFFRSLTLYVLFKKFVVNLFFLFGRFLCVFFHLWDLNLHTQAHTLCDTEWKSEKLRVRVKKSENGCAGARFAAFIPIGRKQIINEDEKRKSERERAMKFEAEIIKARLQIFVWSRALNWNNFHFVYINIQFRFFCSLLVDIKSCIEWMFFSLISAFSVYFEYMWN